MKHDIFSRGLTESIVTTLAFLATRLGWNLSAPRLPPSLAWARPASSRCFSPRRSFVPRPRRAVQFPIAPKLAGCSATAASISGYDLLNAVIVRLDVIMLGCFVGRAPGVTLATVGIYGAVVEMAGGLRKVNQAFNPIFAPLIAGMTAMATRNTPQPLSPASRNGCSGFCCRLLAVMVFAGSVILSIYGTAFRQGATWLGIVAAACATNCFRRSGRNRDHGATAASIC